MHDPQLLPLVPGLRRRGKKVIFDSHEDYLSTIPKIRWIPKLLRPIVKFFYGLYEEYSIKKVNGAIVCYHWTEDRYKRYSNNVKMVLNFPIVETPFDSQKIDYNKRAVCFAGGISRQWCHKEIIEALSRLDGVNYELAGRIHDNKYVEELQSSKYCKLVNYHGILRHEEVFSKVYANSSIGMALLDYISQCKGTIGNLSNTKLFEYMYMGLPVICTDFTLWKTIIDEENCGICVNPHDVDAIAEAIDYLFENPHIAKQMGINGQKAVIEKYNWQTEEKKLLEFYDKL